MIELLRRLRGGSPATANAGVEQRLASVAQDAGMSTIEVLAGVAIFALVASGSSVLSIGSMRATTSSRQATVAATLIYDKVDQLRSLDPAANPADLTAGNHSDALNPLKENGEAGGRFTRTWFVTQDSPQIGLSEVVVTVSWKDYGVRTIRGTTYVCRRASCA